MNQKKASNSSKWILWIFAIGCLGSLCLVSFYDLYKETLPLWIRTLGQGLSGNLFIGVICSFLFLLLTFYWDKRTEEKIDHIQKVVCKSEELISKRERLLKEERLMLQFEQFMKTESHAHAKFPNLKPKTSFGGLTYHIIPMRFPETGEPVKYVTEMHTRYVVKVTGPAYSKYLSPKQCKEYENSPILEDAFYFCSFFNGSWQMDDQSLLTSPHTFYLCGKDTGVEYGQSANKYMESINGNPFADMQEIDQLLLKDDGTKLIGTGGCTPYKIYQDKERRLFLQILDSLPKKMYYTNSPNTYDDTGWFLVIEGIGGYASGKKLENIKAVILNSLTEKNIEIAKIPWYKLEVDSLA